MADNTSTFMELTASIVSAYVRHNSLSAAELPALIEQVHTALTRVSHGEALGNALRPAIPVKKSIASDYIICLENGKKFKSLKRHLRTHHNLTPEQYREKGSWQRLSHGGAEIDAALEEKTIVASLTAIAHLRIANLLRRLMRLQSAH